MRMASMKNWMLRGIGLMAMSTSLLACVGMEDDLALETDELATEAEEGTMTTEKDLTAAAAARRQVPLVVELYQDANYGGDRRTVIGDESMLGHGSGCTAGLWFGDVVSSVKVRKGPDYAAWVASNGGAKPYVYLYENNGFGGRRVALDVGGYPDLGTLSFADKASSIAIVTTAQPPADLNQAPRTAPDFGRISVILEAHTSITSKRCNEANYKMTLLRSAWDIARDYGAAFNDKISSIDVIPGTSFDGNKELTLFVNSQYQGFHDGFYHGHGAINDLRVYGLNDVISSVQLQF
jgi:hypothetical protein